jgi:hypothetical protein
MSYYGWKGVCGGGERAELEGERGRGFKVHIHHPPMSAPVSGLLDKMRKWFC